ncbi:hypothetical protein B0A55_12300, partial [Friedmanniomyces simplex]
ATQQAQQAAFQQNAALPAVPVDVLKGVPPEHVLAIIQALQSGQLTLPPVPAAPQPIAAATAPATAGPSVAPTASTQQTGEEQEDVDMDKEDGELEEGEEPETAQEREFLRPPPTGPRKASPDFPQVSPDEDGFSESTERQAGAAARAFVLQMHNAGYTFEQLAQEIPNKKALTRMYKFLNLSLPTESAPPPVNGTATRPPQPLQLDGGATHAIAPVAAEVPSASPTRRLPPPRPAGPPDRAAYLAKLAAAKNPRARAPAAPLQAPETLEAPARAAAQNAPVQPQPIQQPVQQPATPSVAPRPTPQPSNGKSAIKTELVKQKLEALKAERAAKANAAQSSIDGLISSTPAVKSVTAAQNLKQLLDQPSTTAPNSPFSIARKRPVAADFDNDHVRSAPKRPFSFGQIRSNSESERLVIEVSDDDDDEEDDKDLDPTPVQAPANGTSQRPLPPPLGGLSGLGTRSNLTSAPGMLGSNTADIAGKDKAIADMKRMIAEREAQQAQLRALKANGKIAASATASGQSTPMVPTPTPLMVDTIAVGSGSSAPPPISATVKSPGSTTTERTLSATAIAREQERARLQQRFDELKEQMAGRDDAVISPSPAAAVKEVAAGTDAADELVPLEVGATEDYDGEVRDKSAEAAFENAPGSTGLDVQEPAGLDVPANDGRVESQATTVTGTSQQDEVIEQTSQAPLISEGFPSAVAEANGGPEMAGELAIQSVSDAASVMNEDVDMDVESSEDDDDEDGDRDDDLDDMDGPAAPARGEAAMPANTSTLIHERAQAVDDDTSSASSTGSEDYEPEPVQGIPSEEGEVKEDEEEDEYEPTPAMESPAVAGDEGEEEEEEEEEAETYEPTIDVADLEAGDASEESTPAQVSSAKDSSQTNGTAEQYEIADDLVPELQPPIANQTVVQDEHKDKHQHQDPTTTYYRPYESLLAKFHDYRYHPEYPRTVAGGYKSLTYSHNIDPDTPWCPHEAAGGQCNDRACGSQHFRSMGITDNDLLKALTADHIPASTAEEKARWKSGLTAVFQELRRQGLNKDARVIAARIVEFRREFVGGGSVVLDLDLGVE